jgi:hypothetical protein
MPEFHVKVRDKRTDEVSTISVGQNENITCQADAENYLLAMSTSIGGKHPGFELAKDDAAAK